MSGLKFLLQLFCMVLIQNCTFWSFVSFLLSKVCRGNLYEYWLVGSSHQRGSFVCHSLGHTSIFKSPLSYPLRYNVVCLSNSLKYTFFKIFIVSEIYLAILATRSSNKFKIWLFSIFIQNVVLEETILQKEFLRIFSARIFKHNM